MSTTIQTAQQIFEEALHSVDSEEVMVAANKLAEIAGYEEEADILRRQANRLNSEDWQYDENLDNNL